MPTPNQLSLRAAQAPVTRALKPIGFRRSGNYYNREASDGLIQVVGFQSGQSVSMFHGKFTVNLGVYIPCIATIENSAATGRAVSDAHCEIRSRLSKASGIGEDTWWNLDATALKSGELIASMLLAHGVPWLERYASYSAIVARLRDDGYLPFHNPARSSLAVAIIQWSRGEHDEARRLFDLARNTKSHNSRFPDYVAQIQERCGA